MRAIIGSIPLKSEFFYLKAKEGSLGSIWVQGLGPKVWGLGLVGL